MSHFLKPFFSGIILLGIFSFVHAQPDMILTTFDEEEITGGGSSKKDFTFPADLSGYDSISMKIALTCPPGGCDPWDRFGKLQVEKDGEKIEIGRFVTPYGNDWCDWGLDVTEYRELLTGTVSLIGHIETWQNGWALTITFEFWNGTPQYEHILVQNLWVDYGFIYGDTMFFQNRSGRTLLSPA